MRVIVTVSTQKTAADPVVTRETFTFVPSGDADQDDNELSDLGGYIRDAIRGHADG